MQIKSKPQILIQIKINICLSFDVNVSKHFSNRGFQLLLRSRSTKISTAVDQVSFRRKLSLADEKRYFGSMLLISHCSRQLASFHFNLRHST